MDFLVLSISQGIITISILIFFFRFFKEDKAYRKALEDKVLGVPEAIHQKVLETVQEMNTHIVSTSSANFSNYLKHIQNLERMVLPKPITQQDVESVWMRGTPPAENEISNTPTDEGIELNENNFKDIPLTGNTNIVFDTPGGESPSFGAEIPTSID